MILRGKLPRSDLPKGDVTCRLGGRADAMLIRVDLAACLSGLPPCIGVGDEETARC